MMSESHSFPEDLAPSSAPGLGWGVSNSRAEVLLVLGVSLGQSAVYSVLSIIEKLTRETPLNEQTTTINSSVVPDRAWLDLAYQLAGIVFPLVVAHVILDLVAFIGYALVAPLTDWF